MKALATTLKRRPGAWAVVRVPLLALALAFATVAGCLGGSPATTTSASKAAATPTLAAPPAWRVGEWWDVKVTDAFDRETHEAKRVVAGMEGDRYLVGMPKDAFSNELMVLHLPGFGEVAKSTLGYSVHDAPFEPVRFPLVDGLRWETAFEGIAFHAVASVGSPTLAEIDMTSAGGGHIHLTYDAAVGDVTRVVFDGYATLEVTGHGYGYAGVVTVPRMAHLAFAEARTGPVLSSTQQPASPLQTVQVDDAYDRISFVLLAGSLLPLVEPGAPDQAAGYYDDLATGPDGARYDLQVFPTDTGLKAAYHMVDKPGGAWAFRQVVGGPGIAVAEGIAYRVENVELPAAPTR